MASSMESFTWKLDTRKTRFEGGCYTSPIFCLLGFTWLAKFYREHKSAPNNATVTLYLVDLPPNMQQITIRRRVHIMETNTVSDQTKIFKDSKGQGWPKGTLSTKSIQHLHYFTIQIEMMLISKYHKHEMDEHEYVYNDEHDEQLANRSRGSIDQPETTEMRLDDLSTKMSILMKSVSSMQHTLKQIQTQMHRKQLCEEELERKEKAEREVHGQVVHDDNRKQDMHAFRQWMLGTLKLPEYYQLFVEHGVDSLDVVQLISGDTLDVLGISKIGHRMKILQQIESLRQRTTGEIYEGITACYHQY